MPGKHHPHRNAKLGDNSRVFWMPHIKGDTQFIALADEVRKCFGDFKPRRGDRDCSAHRMLFLKYNPFIYGGRVRHQTWHGEAPSEPNPFARLRMGKSCITPEGS